MFYYGYVTIYYVIATVSEYEMIIIEKLINIYNASSYSAIFSL